METQSSYNTESKALFSHLTAMNEGLKFRVTLIDKRQRCDAPMSGAEFRAFMEYYCGVNEVYFCEVVGVRKVGFDANMNLLTWDNDSIKAFEDELQFVDVRVRSREADAYTEKLHAEYLAKKAAKEVAQSYNIAA